MPREHSLPAAHTSLHCVPGSTNTAWWCSREHKYGSIVLPGAMHGVVVHCSRHTHPDHVLQGAASVSACVCVFMYTDRQTDRKTDRQTDRQTHVQIYTCKKAYIKIHTCMPLPCSNVDTKETSRIRKRDLLYMQIHRPWTWRKTRHT